MKKQKSKFRFNVVDVIVIVIVIALVGILYFEFFAPREEVLSKEVKIQYVIGIDSLDKEYIDEVVESRGGRICDKFSGEDIGEVLSVVTCPASFVPLNADAYDYYNVLIKVEANAREAEGFFEVSGTEIKSGQPIYFTTSLFTGVGYCTSFQVVE